MNFDDNHRFLHLSVRLLRLTFIWPRVGDFRTWSEIVYQMLSLCALLVVFSDLVLRFYGLLIFWVDDLEGLEVFLEDVIVFFTGVVSFVKFIIIVSHQRILHEMKKRLNSDLYRQMVKTEDERQIMAKCKKHETKLTYTLMVFTYIVAFMYTASPIIKTLRDNREYAASGLLRNETTRTGFLPMKTIFKTPRWSTTHLLLYGQQQIMILLLANLSTMPDALFTSLIYYLVGFFKILKVRLTEHQDAKEQKEYVQQHNEVLLLAQEIYAISKPMLILQMWLSSFLICLGVFQITLVSSDNPLQYVKFVLYFAIKFSQLFLYCWHGQEVIEKSQQLSDICYETAWYIAPHKLRSNTRFIMMRTQKPVVFEAGGFFTLSLTSFKNVLRTAYSYLALLQTMSDLN